MFDCEQIKKRLGTMHLRSVDLDSGKIVGVYRASSLNASPKYGILYESKAHKGNIAYYEDKGDFNFTNIKINESAGRGDKI